MCASPARPHPRDDLDQRVHEAVLALLAEQGVRLSMDAVASRAGCSKQTLYAHFGSKHELLQRVMREHLGPTPAELDLHQGDLRSALLAFAERHLERLGTPQVIQASRLIDAEALQFPEETRDLWYNGAEDLLARLSAHLRAASERGLLRHDDPHFMAELLLAMIVGLDFERQRFHVPHRAGATARRRWAETAVDGFLRGFAAAPSSNQDHQRSFSP